MFQAGNIGQNEARSPRLAQKRPGARGAHPNCSFLRRLNCRCAEALSRPKSTVRSLESSGTSGRLPLESL
eukprot:9109556-Pyramimonas_sp.AAC.1